MKSRVFILLKLVFINLFLFAGLNLQAQSKVFTFQDAALNGIYYEEMDSLYSHTTDEKINEGYIDFLRDMAIFLKWSGFEFNETTRLFTKTYLAPDGRVDYFLYYFMTEKRTPDLNINKHRQQELERLVNLFLKDYKFKLPLDDRTVLYSPVMYKD